MVTEGTVLWWVMVLNCKSEKYNYLSVSIIVYHIKWYHYLLVSIVIYHRKWHFTKYPCFGLNDVKLIENSFWDLLIHFTTLMRRWIGWALLNIIWKTKLSQSLNLEGEWFNMTFPTTHKSLLWKHIIWVFNVTILKVSHSSQKNIYKNKQKLRTKYNWDIGSAIGF